MILFVDFETQGLMVDGVPSDDPRQPGPVSLSAILDDETGRTRRVMSSIVSDLAPFRDTGAEKVHGITREMAAKFGRPLVRIMEDFMEMAALADIFCAFNSHFDAKFVKISCHRCNRLDWREQFEAKQSLCVMIAAAGFLKGEGQRRISLKDAHTQLFGAPHGSAHGSLPDAYAARRIYYHLKEKGARADTTDIKRTYQSPFATRPAGKGADLAGEVEF